MQKNRLVRYLAPHVAGGFAIGGLIVAGLLANNAVGLWTLVSQSDAGPMAAGLLIFFTGLTFASVQTGIAIMMLGRQDEEDSRRGRRLPPGSLQPIPVRIRARNSNGR